MDLLQFIKQSASIPYIYSYPTTRAYESNTNFDISKVKFSENINLYFHIPFCNQKCSFCGYLTTVGNKQNDYESYVEALIQEIASATHVHGRRINTINFGGGTPMLLSENQIIKIMKQIEKSFPNFLNTATEISIEATPESINSNKIELLSQLGFNRISIGVQSLNDNELKGVRRCHISKQTQTAINQIKNSNIKNLCCDLMYGLPGQNLTSWQQTIKDLISYRPETIELYRTVAIPGTSFISSKQEQMSLIEKHRAYELARNQLLNSGYVQDSHLRFILPNKGFYQQQVNVFKGESLCGFGVGARSYTNNFHYRNSYSSSKHQLAIRRYIDLRPGPGSKIESAVFLNHEERLRRFIIYNLESLDLKKIQNEFSCDLAETHKNIWEILRSLGFISIEKNFIRLKPKAAYYRDTLAYYFFSRSSKIKEAKYYKGLNGIGL
ncbi:MAG: coproporphyrinogen-III oxidase family protein [Candidatus Falkowbacteria bacterium]|nr:coproporphyrinogen-III oxidase family protein [Candidatus Falkowbacteria bacterium]